MSDLVRRVRCAAAVIAFLPEMPGYNGSVLLIDDVEASTIARDLGLAADELERLTKELEEARKDQARYRWLRHGDNDEQMLRFSACARCGTDDVWVLREDALDAAIDAALSQEK